MGFDPDDLRNLIYARPPENGKIFVSSKMTGDPLKAERRAAIEAIEEFPLAKPWAWEDTASASRVCRVGQTRLWRAGWRSWPTVWRVHPVEHARLTAVHKTLRWPLRFLRNSL